MTGDDYRSKRAEDVAVREEKGKKKQKRGNPPRHTPPPQPPRPKASARKSRRAQARHALWKLFFFLGFILCFYVVKEGSIHISKKIVFIFYARVTINKDGKEEKKKRREESMKDNSCVYHQRENCRRRQPAGRFFVSLLGR